MYRDYFGLNERPFSIAPDPRYLYLTEQHEDALAHLIYGLQDDGGIVLLTGEVGTGKTTLSRKLLESLPDNIDIAWIINPRLSAKELLASICDELSIPYATGTDSIKQFTDLISAHLIEAHGQGRNIVVMIDEAQNLQADTLEQLRLLTNLETNERKLLQIVLLGQPELKHILEGRELRQLSQRITARFHLEPLNRTESDAYIRHRLNVAGCDRPIFSSAALRRLYRLSFGIPRLINLLCDRAMLGAYSRGESMVSAAHAGQAYREITGKHPPMSWPLIVAISLFLLLSVAMALYSMTAPDQQQHDLSASSQRFDIPHSAEAEPSDDPAAIATAETALLPEPVLKSESVAQAKHAPPAGPVTPTKPITTPQRSHASKAPPTPEIQVHEIEAPLLQQNGPSDQQDFWHALQSRGNKNSAMQTLGAIWGTPSDAVAPDASPAACEQWHSGQLRCLQINANNWLLREYNRPAMIAIRSDSGAIRHAVIRQIDNPLITLQIGRQTWQVDRSRLEQRWLGKATLLWHPPSGFTHTLKTGDRGKAVEWLAARLDHIQGKTGASTYAGAVMDQTMVSRLRSFQRREDFDATGTADALTLIRLSDRSGQPSPTLRPEG